MTSYADECRLRAQMLLDAADGVGFQVDNGGDGGWVDVAEPLFIYPTQFYRRKPKKVRHERVVVWYQVTADSAVRFDVYPHEDALNRHMKINRFIELKRETVWVEVEE